MRRVTMRAGLASALVLLFAAAAQAQSPREARNPSAPRLLPGGAAEPVRDEARAASASTRPAALAGTRLLAASAAGVQFEVDVPEPVLAPVAEAPGFTALSIDGYESAGRVGAPALPRRVVLVAVPPGGDVRVRATGLEARRFDGVRVVPQPHAPREAPEERTWGALPDVYAQATDVAPERARLLGVSWMRHQRVAEVEILPASYVPATGAVRAYGRVAVSVEFGGAPAALAPGGPPPDAFEWVYASTLVNYEQGRAWRGAANAARDAAPAALQGGAVVPDTSVFAGRTWVKIAIPATGFYRVTYQQLRLLPEFATSTPPLDSLRMFTWPGFPVLPEDSYCDSCEFHEVAIDVVDGATPNGTFGDNDDAIEFFAMGPSDWADLYDPARPDTVFINNPYETNNYYYLTFGTANLAVGGTPRRYAQRSGQIVNPSAPTPATFDARRHLEQDLEYFPDPTSRSSFLTLNTLFWEKWYWRSLSQGQSFQVPFDLPNLDETQPARLRTSVWGITYTKPSQFVPFCPLGEHRAAVGVNATLPLDRYWRLNTGHIFDSTYVAGTILETGNVLSVNALGLACVNFSHRVALAWADVFFQQRFEAIDDELNFDAPAAPGEYLYEITGFAGASPPRVLDVTDAYAPVEITDLEYTDTGSGRVLRFQSTEPGRRRYRVIQPSSVVELKDALAPRSALATSTQNLRSPTLGADYLVIYYDAFKAAADSLLAWRESHLPLIGTPPPYEALGVPISALFDQFSGGRTDPAAIRNFLRAAYTHWRKVPAFVTFLGDASFDFKDLLGRARPGDPGCLLPSYEGGYDPTGSVERQYATDDWLMNVDDPLRVIPDFFGGRIPAIDLASATTYVRSKLLAYERSTLYGTWRNRFMLVADDDKQGENDDLLRWTHLSQTAQLDSGFTASHIDRAYVYLHKYPDGPGATKPGAKQAIITGINDGVAVMNYVGHGSPFKMADESVFLDTDTGALDNADRLTVFVAASCDIGKFNDPRVPSIGERLVLESGGGAVGVVSATELALSNQNAQLNRVLYSGLFDRTATGGTYEVGFAQALLAAKLGATTTQKYQLMGDAGLRPNLPRLSAEFTLWDSAGTAPLAEVERGRTVTVRGQVHDAPGGTALALDGVGSLLIEDSAPYEQAPPCSADPNCSIVTRPFYYYAAGPMFRGDVAIRGGAFESRFVVPLEGKLGARGRVRLYFTGRAPGAAVTTDGVGSTRLQISPGQPPAGDTEGPLITLSFPGGATSVKPDAVLTIGLSDPNGILTTGHTLQNGIIVTVDDNTTARVDVTASFRYAADSYQDGTATFQLPNLAPGTHKVRVSAADNLAAGLDAAAHRSSAELTFEVQEEPPLRISRAYLFPNPIRSGGAGSGGQFVVDTPGDSVNVLIRVYTVSGRQVKALRAFGGLGQVQLPWDGRDSEGYELANGVYFYRVHVNPLGEDGESDASRKAVAEGRIVVVGH